MSLGQVPLFSILWKSLCTIGIVFSRRLGGTQPLTSFGALHVFCGRVLNYRFSFFNDYRNFQVACFFIFNFFQTFKL